MFPLVFYYILLVVCLARCSWCWPCGLHTLPARQLNAVNRNALQVVGAAVLIAPLYTLRTCTIARIPYLRTRIRANDSPCTQVVVSVVIVALLYALHAGPSSPHFVPLMQVGYGRSCCYYLCLYLCCYGLFIGRLRKVLCLSCR